MEKLSSKCTNCQCIIRYSETSEGKVISCPKCKNETKLTSIPTNIIQANITSSSDKWKPEKLPTTSEKVINNISNFSEFPERMKASKALAGTNCTICNEQIDLGDDIVNCKSCNSSIMHQPCYDKKAACGNSNCGSNSEKIVTQSVANNENENTSGDMKDCPYCGEKIKALSKKCRYCGEYLDKKLRARENQLQKDLSEDEKISLTEIIFCSVCGGIACIVSIIYLIQGKKKAWKMLGISLLSILFWSLIKGINR